MKEFFENPFFVIVCLVVIGVGGYYAYKNKDNFKRPEKNVSGIFYDLSAMWGPCPTEEEGACSGAFKINLNGDYYENGSKTTTGKFDEATINSILTAINDSNIMNKECTGSEITDYQADYKLTINGKTKEIKYPGCVDDLDKIDQLIGSVLNAQ